MITPLPFCDTFDVKMSRIDVDTVVIHASSESIGGRISNHERGVVPDYMRLRIVVAAPVSTEKLIFLEHEGRQDLVRYL